MGTTSDDEFRPTDGSAQPPRAERVFAAPAGPPEPDSGIDQHGLRVRPYVLTGGRTRSRSDLAVETLVSTEPAGVWERPYLSSEYLAIRRLCRQPKSVAEVAALLSVPLGVVRVLLTDLADAELIRVHRTNTTGRPDQDLMQRVLDGLRKL